jgi:hypothetical protein
MLCSVGSLLLTIWEKLLVPSLVVKQSRMAFGGGSDSLSQNVGNYQSALLNIPENQRFQHQPIYVYIKIRINVM